MLGDFSCPAPVVRLEVSRWKGGYYDSPRICRFRNVPLANACASSEGRVGSRDLSRIPAFASFEFHPDSFELAPTFTLATKQNPEEPPKTPLTKI